MPCTQQLLTGNLTLGIFFVTTISMIVIVMVMVMMITMIMIVMTAKLRKAVEVA
jgi:hypothetical protein